MPWLIREYEDDDFEAVLRLLDATAGGQASVFSLPEVVMALRSRLAAVVAVRHGVTVGCAVAAVSGDRAWVVRLAIRDDLRGQGMASQLLLALDRPLARAHVRRVAYVLPHEEQVTAGLLKAGYESHPAVAYFEKQVSLEPGQAAVLEALGGEVLPPRLWADLLGMTAEKDLIERRVLAPLMQPELAAQHGVAPPRGIMLFGPPGTGKTTFARGIAARLGWPFVELLPSRLADDESGLAAGLRAAFAGVGQLDRVVVFIDEFEEIAATRTGAGSGHLHGITNELLKLVPVFRQRANRLLVCATNAVSSLDPAVLRPGRFDYVIPIGAPDEAARLAQWSSRADPTRVDVAALVAASAHMTAAEIQHAAATAAQASFERALVDGAGGEVTPGPTTADHLAAINGIRRSLTREIRDGFAAEIDGYARH